LSLESGVNAPVRALQLRSQTELMAGGDFRLVDGDVSAFVARYVSTCVPTVTVSGTGCASSGGSNTLAADNLPWADAVFRDTATGLPSRAIAVSLISFTSIAQGALPVVSVLPEGLPGCDVLVFPEIVLAQLTTTGSASLELFLPNTPPLTGVTFYHQMIVIEVDTQLTFLEITATNALQLVAGDF
jgi:hypothetical protein